jgi:hypothetical protein
MKMLLNENNDFKSSIITDTTCDKIEITHSRPYIFLQQEILVIILGMSYSTQIADKDIF